MTKKEMQARIDELEREVANLRLMLSPSRYVETPQLDPFKDDIRTPPYEPEITCYWSA